MSPILITAQLLFDILAKANSDNLEIGLMPFIKHKTEKNAKSTPAETAPVTTNFLMFSFLF